MCGHQSTANCEPLTSHARKTYLTRQCHAARTAKRFRIRRAARASIHGRYVSIPYSHSTTCLTGTARRLARLRLLATPVLEQPPVSQLGFDPVDSHPTLEEFQNLLSKKKGTIKGVIMDQSFSAGVGNWVADESVHFYRRGVLS